MFVAGLFVCLCGFGLLWLMAGEEYGGWGLWRFFWDVLWGFFFMGVLLWREKGCEGGFWGLCGDVRGVGVLGREGLKMCSEGGSVCWVVFLLVCSCSCGACAPFPLAFGWWAVVRPWVGAIVCGCGFACGCGEDMGAVAPHPI